MWKRMSVCYKDSDDCCTDRHKQYRGLNFKLVKLIGNVNDWTWTLLWFLRKRWIRLWVVHCVSFFSFVFSSAAAFICKYFRFQVQTYILFCLFRRPTTNRFHYSFDWWASNVIGELNKLSRDHRVERQNKRCDSDHMLELWVNIITRLTFVHKLTINSGVQSCRRTCSENHCMFEFFFYFFFQNLLNDTEDKEKKSTGVNYSLFFVSRIRIHDVFHRRPLSSCEFFPQRKQYVFYFCPLLLCTLCWLESLDKKAARHKNTRHESGLFIIWRSIAQDILNIWRSDAQQ